MSSVAERDLAAIWHPYSPLSETPAIEITRASGELLFTADGTPIIDLISSWWVNLHGHCHPHIQARIARQLETLDHVIFAGFTHQPAVELAEGLLRHLPAGQDRIFFSDNGSTAVEVAIKMAMQFWSNRQEPRQRIAVLAGSYHGDTVGAMSVSERGIFTRVFKEMLFDVVVLPRPDSGGDNFLTAVKELLEGDLPAAFIYEPLIQGAGGMYVYPATVLDSALALFQRKEVVCIADEVMTGFGRSGKWFASDYLENKPDLITLSKGITGGVMPLGATSCNERIASEFKSNDRSRTFFHGHSYTGNPIACAAALASLELMEQPETWNRIAAIGQRHIQMAMRLKDHARVLDVRTCGTILALTVSDANPGYLSPLATRIYDFALKSGALIRPLGNVIYLMPPYCISTENLEMGYRILTDAIN